MRSVPQAVLHWARETPDAIATVEAGQDVTYRDLAMGIRRLALALRASGVEQAPGSASCRRSAVWASA